MKDYNQPPTEEFAWLTKSPRYQVMSDEKYYPWMTMMKSVMNDYWFDCSNIESYRWDYEILDELFHKLYYCWYMTMKEIHGGEEE